MKKYYRILTAIFIVGVIAAFTVKFVLFTTHLVYETKCRDTLRCCYGLILFYASDMYKNNTNTIKEIDSNFGKVYWKYLPVSIMMLTNHFNQEVVIDILHCPGARKKRKGNGGGNTIDYFYIPWTNLTVVPCDYPLMYDRHMSNHDGKGINIITVEGEIFWDKNAEWLQKFAQEHPEYNMPMPMELKSE